MYYSDEEDEVGFACLHCESTRFHIEDGRYYCEQGHEAPRSQVVGRDDDDWGTLGRRHRAAREKAERGRATKVYRGKDAFELFLQAYQLILWRQCHELIDQKHLPSDIWTIVYDLWSIRLSQVLDKLQSPEDSYDVSAASTSEAAETTETENPGAPLRPSTRSKRQHPQLIETLGLCYLALLILKLPVSVGEVFRWVIRGDITYIRAIRRLPIDMLQRLPGEYHDALDTTTLPDMHQLSKTIKKLVRLYSTNFGISFPAINTDILLFRHIQSLALPVEVFATVRSLAEMLHIDFTYPSLRSSVQQDRMTDSPEIQLISLVVVAVKLLFPFDARTKELYPFTVSEPAVQNLDWDLWLELHKNHVPPVEKSALQTRAEDVPDSSMSSTASRPPLMVTAPVVFDMSPAELDNYMDWYQRTWAKPEIEEKGDANREILKMFPLVTLNSSQQTRQDHPAEDLEMERGEAERLIKVHQNMKLRPTIPDTDDHEYVHEVRRPGQKYRTVKLSLQNGLIPSETNPGLDSSHVERAFLEVVAEHSELDLKDLVRAVGETERSVSKWLDGKRRADYYDHIDNAEQQESGEDQPDTS